MARAKANTYSFLITFFVALGSFTYGFNSAIVASVLGRFLNGVGIGVINSTVPTYQSELAPASQRGRLVGSHGFLLVSGYVGDFLFETHMSQSLTASTRR